MNNEIRTLSLVLRALRIEDVFLDYDEKGLVAWDSMDNIWHNEEFYRFLIDEAFVFTCEGEVLGIRPELYKDFMEFAHIREMEANYGKYLV